MLVQVQSVVGWLLDNCFVFPILFCSTNTKDIAVLGAISGWLVGGLLRYLILCFDILYATLSL